jgi:uncharacterized protein DUF861
MTGLIRKSLDSPEETRPFHDGKGKLELVNLESGAVGRATFEPVWQWSKHVKPIAQTSSCQAAHMGYFVSGRMKVVMDDGEGMEFGPGDFAVMAPGQRSVDSLPPTARGGDITPVQPPCAAVPTARGRFGTAVRRAPARPVPRRSGRA